MNDQRPEPLNPAYGNARFRFEAPTGGMPEMFAVVTACNSDGKEIPEEENAKRTERFRKELVQLGYDHFSVTGYDAQSSWAEAGFGVVCDWRVAYLMGKTLSQDAVFHVENRMVHLVDCRPGGNPEPKSLRPWSDMAD